MNVFVLAAAVCDAAELHNDAHVVKMPQEGVQILSTALRLLGNTLQGRKDFNPRHPWVRWAASHPLHLRYIYDMTMALFEECGKRYNKSLEDYYDIHSGNMKRIKEVLDSGDFSQCINNDPNTAPDPSLVLIWDSCNSNRVRNEARRKEFEEQQMAEKAGVNRRKRKLSDLDQTKELDLAETNLPEGLKCVPLCMEDFYYVRDPDGKVRGIDSYRNSYLDTKLLRPFVKKTMHTYNHERMIPKEFKPFMRT